jgi:isopentenyl-diphosphate Delta-isomerase
MNEYDEIFDVVDSDDNVVGKASRLQVHKNELMHRSTHILVFNAVGNLFIQKRAMAKDESPGLWDSSAAGHVESGEDYISCANRELKEELELSEHSLEEVLSIPAQKKTFWEHVRVYKCITNKNIYINKNEISEGKYLTLFELRISIKLNPDMYTSTFNHIYYNYINFLG